MTFFDDDFVYERDDEYQDDSHIGCLDCPDDECNGHCLSCPYRPY